MEGALSILNADYRSMGPIVVFLTSFTLIYYLIQRFRSTTRMGAVLEGGRRLPYPPSIGFLPLVGSIPYLPRKMEDLHKFCLEKTNTLGGMFSMKIGNKLVIYLTTYESIHEAFVRKSTSFADRPTHYWDRLINPNLKGIALRHYDPEYKRYHNLSLKILKEFGFGQSIIEARIAEEVTELVQKIKNVNGNHIDPREMVVSAVEKIIAGILFGQQIEHTTVKELFKLCVIVFDSVLGILPLDILPILRHINPFRKIVDKIITSRQKAYILIEKIIDDLAHSDRKDNFVSYFVHHEGKEYDREQLVMTVMEFMMAGSDTSSNTILWALILLANNTGTQDRIQTEIDATVPRGRRPSWSDKAKLPYLEAAILEVFRCKTLVPNGVPHGTLQDTELMGYFIPKDTMVMPVLYAAHMDKSVWSDPEEFKPERFLDDSGKVINKDFMIAFSVGKRSCLGEQLARQEVFLFLTALLQQFHIRPPDGFDLVDYKEEARNLLVPGPFKLRFIPRHSTY